MACGRSGRLEFRDIQWEIWDECRDVIVTLSYEISECQTILICEYVRWHLNWDIWNVRTCRYDISIRLVYRTRRNSCSAVSLVVLSIFVELSLIYKSMTESQRQVVCYLKRLGWTTFWFGLTHNTWLVNNQSRLVLDIDTKNRNQISSAPASRSDLRCHRYLNTLSICPQVLCCYKCTRLQLKMIPQKPQSRKATWWLGKGKSWKSTMIIIAPFVVNACVCDTAKPGE